MIEKERKVCVGHSLVNVDIWWVEHSKTRHRQSDNIIELEALAEVCCAEECSEVRPVTAAAPTVCNSADVIVKWALVTIPFLPYCVTLRHRDGNRSTCSD
jgi:hypothetical protein